MSSKSQKNDPVFSLSRNGNSFMIHCNGLLHLVFQVEKIHLLRSHFLKGQNKFFIEVVTPFNQITLEYDTKDKFEQVLKFIERAVNTETNLKKNIHESN